MTRAERRARERLADAMGRYADNYGEARWYNGVRAAGRDTRAMMDKEMAFWKRCDKAEAEYTRALAALLRVVRKEARDGK